VRGRKEEEVAGDFGGVRGRILRRKRQGSEETRKQEKNKKKRKC
jgi:hypothetical protein